MRTFWEPMHALALVDKNTDMAVVRARIDQAFAQKAVAFRNVEVKVGNSLAQAAVKPGQTLLVFTCEGVRR